MAIKGAVTTKPRNTPTKSNTLFNSVWGVTVQVFVTKRQVV
jgi:hypothetical protein